MTSGDPAVFLSGADMDPERIIARWPAAAFLARATLTPATGAPVEGIALRIPADASGAAATGATVEIVTDAGQRLTALVAPPPEDRAGQLAAARYWELPPRYVQALAAALNETEPEPEGGFDTPVPGAPA